jgi:hypothetical protein
MEASASTSAAGTSAAPVSSTWTSWTAHLASQISLPNIERNVNRLKVTSIVGSGTHVSFSCPYVTIEEGTAP